MSKPGPSPASSACGLLLLVGLLCAVLSAGCTALVAPVLVGVGGVGVQQYCRGEYRDYVDAPFGHCEHAVKDVARRFMLQTVDCHDSGTTRIFHLRDVHGFPFRVKIQPLTSHSTRIAIRVGTWGDRVCSAKLVSEIRECATRQANS